MTSHRHEQSTLNFEHSDLEQERDHPVECLDMTFENDNKRREYFLEKLREKLKDPEFRKIEGFPIGEDEDILALSDPPYYTACPNPFIEDFIKHYGKPYDPETNDYRREPFAADVSEGKSDSIYNAHTYHTKVPHKAIMRYILHYTEPGDIVFDGFCGTGMTAVASYFCSKKTEIESLGLNVLNETDEKSVYAQGNRYSIQDPRLIAWMVEASLHAHPNGSAAIKDLFDGPSIFPFRLAHLSAENLVSLSPRLDLLRHGLDDNLVMLRHNPNL